MGKVRIKNRELLVRILKTISWLDDRRWTKDDNYNFLKFLEKSSRIHIPVENSFHIGVESDFHIPMENKIPTPTENKIPIVLDSFNLLPL